jgi:NOL1/NOP2/fmu family ribosome biogenesis protein
VDEALSPSSSWLVDALARPDRLLAQRDSLFLAPDDAPDMSGLRVVRSGLPLGTAKPGRFEPAHALALAIQPADARNVVDLSLADAEHYLSGEPLPIAGDSGWTLVTVDGWPLGWGRRSNNIVKNHYPKGLRRV